MKILLLPGTTSICFLCFGPIAQFCPGLGLQSFPWRSPPRCPLNAAAATVRRRSHRHQWERSLSSSTSNCTRISWNQIWGPLCRHPQNFFGRQNHPVDGQITQWVLLVPPIKPHQLKAVETPYIFQSHHRIHLKEPPCLAKMQTFHQAFVWVVFFA